MREKETTPKVEEVVLIKACTHAGESKKVGDKVFVAKGQLVTMRLHGLVK